MMDGGDGLMKRDHADMRLLIRRAAIDDAPILLSLWLDAAEWLQAKGIDQWHPSRFSLDGAIAAIRDAEVYIAELGREAVGTYLIMWSDPVIWRELDDGEAGYIHKLAVRRDCKGRGLVLKLLRDAERRIAGRGKRLIRLDCMADNERLNRYYLDAGYAFVRRHVDDGWSANLYEKRAADLFAEGDRFDEEDCD